MPLINMALHISYRREQHLVVPFIIAMTYFCEFPTVLAGFHCSLAWCSILFLEPSKQFFEVVALELPIKRNGDGLKVPLETE